MQPNHNLTCGRGLPLRRMATGILSVLVLALAGCGAAPLNPPTVSPTPTAAPEKTAAPTVRLAVGEWPPYTGQKLSHSGCDAQLVAEAFALAGLSVEYGFFPWARSYHLSENGTWDGTLEWADTPAHRATHHLSADYVSKQEWVFFHRQDQPLEWQSLDDLAGKVIGVTTEYVYSDAFAGLKQKKLATFSEAPSDEANLKKLLAKRIDIFPMERRVGQALLAANFTPEERAQITIHPKPISAFFTYLLLSKAVPQNRQRLEAFNHGFSRLKASGRYAEIMDACPF